MINIYKIKLLEKCKNLFLLLKSFNFINLKKIILRNFKYYLLLCFIINHAIIL